MKKKVLSVMMCAAMVLALGACGNKQEEAAAPADDGGNEVSTAPAETESDTQGETSTNEAEGGAASSDISGKTIGYYKDAADDYYKAGYEVFEKLVAQNEETADWEIIDKVGQGTSSEQLAAVEDFITAGVDAIIVVQNSPEITAECITKANDAGIPYFSLTHAPSVPAGGDLAGYAGYDFVEAGVLGGEDALKWNDGKGVTKLVMVEGKLGQGTAAAQSLGFLKAYEDAGKDIGGTYEDVAIDKTKGGADLEIVQWASGDWMADPAKKVVADVITAFGADGFDGLYVQNDEMMDGAIQALEEAGLNPGDYWLGSSNGKEKSWVWVEEGKETMDVNQTPTLEADLLYQQVVSYMKGETYRKYVCPSLIPYNQSNVADLTLIPYDSEKYIEMRNNNEFNYDINDEGTFKSAEDIITFN